MPIDLASVLLRRAVASFRSGAPRCGTCARTPLPGETVHVLEREAVICALCLANLPRDQRRTVRSERIHADERPVSVTPRAA